MSYNKYKVIKRGRGHVMFLQGHQYYSLRKYKNGDSIWRCKNYKSLKCVGSVTVNMDLTATLKLKPHCDHCLPDETQNFVDEVINNACDEAALGRDPAPQVYNRALISLKNQGLHLASKNHIPEFSQIKSTIYRRRNQQAGIKKTNPKNVAEIEVPRTFCDFLLADFSHKKMRILVFCSEEARELIIKCKHFFMDGTFKSCPSPFQQLFSIHGDIGSSLNETNVVPLVYAFMTHRTKKAYSILFDLIFAQIPEWNPQKVTIDFEEGTMKALHNLKVTVKGCYYHYVNSLWRKAKSMGLSKDKRYRKIISLCANLALLPEDKVGSGWAYIQKEIQMIQENQSLLKFQDYFNGYWMKGDFYKTWCVYNERHRTNNAVEGWHHGINNLVTKGHVNLLKILHILRDDSIISSFRTSKKLETSGSSKSPKRRKIDLSNDEYIMNTQMELACGEISVGHFLEKMR